MGRSRWVIRPYCAPTLVIFLAHAPCLPVDRRMDTSVKTAIRPMERQHWCPDGSGHPEARWLAPELLLVASVVEDED